MIDPTEQHLPISSATVRRRRPSVFADIASGLFGGVLGLGLAGYILFNGGLPGIDRLLAPLRQHDAAPVSLERPSAPAPATQTGSAEPAGLAPLGGGAGPVTRGSTDAAAPATPQQQPARRPPAPASQPQR